MYRIGGKDGKNLGVIYLYFNTAQFREVKIDV